MMSVPLVSICCATYNHEEYISTALDSFLAQEVDFPIEIIVNDDASTDRTAEIVREYERRYPGIVRGIYQTTNRYVTGVRPAVHILIPNARGRYVALCEGDDYWTDPAKLKKQVQYLETHDECVLVAGGYIQKHVDGSEHVVIRKPPPKRKSGEAGFVFELIDLTRGWLAQTLTVMFRKAVLPPSWHDLYAHIRDTHLVYNLLKRGSGYYISETLGVHRVHPGGVHSMKRGLINNRQFLVVAQELYEKHRDAYTRIEFVKACMQMYRYLRAQGLISDGDVYQRQLLRTAVRIARTPREFRIILGSLIPHRPLGAIAK